MPCIVLVNSYSSGIFLSSVTSVTPFCVSMSFTPSCTTASSSEEAPVVTGIAFKRASIFVLLLAARSSASLAGAAPCSIRYSEIKASALGIVAVPFS